MRRTWAAASGMAYSVLAAIGIILLVGAEIDGMTDAEIIAHYAESSNRTREIVGFFLVAFAVLFFLWFITILRSRLGPAEGRPSTLSTLGFGAGTAAASLFAGGAAIFAGTSFAAELADGFAVDPNLARFGLSAGYLFLTSGVLAGCVLVISTSVVAYRTDVFPRWLAWTGYAAVVLAVVELFLFPVFVIPAWVLVVSVVLMTRKEIAAIPSEQDVSTMR